MASFRLQKCHSIRGENGPQIIRFFGPTRVNIVNCITICSAKSFSRVYGHEIPTDRPTDRPRYCICNNMSHSATQQGPEQVWYGADADWLYKVGCTLTQPGEYDSRVVCGRTLIRVTVIYKKLVWVSATCCSSVCLDAPILTVGSARPRIFVAVVSAVVVVVAHPALDDAAPPSTCRPAPEIARSAGHRSCTATQTQLQNTRLY